MSDLIIARLEQAVASCEFMELPNNAQTCRDAIVEIERLNDANDALIEIGHRQAERMERLYARVDELTTWTSVKDRMPEPGERVLIYGTRSYQPKGFRRVTLINSYGAWSDERYPEGHNEVTHWIPLPPDPIKALEGDGNGS